MSWPEHTVDLAAIREETRRAIAELLARSPLEAGDLVVVGGSSSEVLGEHLGQASSAEIGRVIVAEVSQQLRAAGLHLAVQCCEHLNRALVVERSWAKAAGLPRVNALPQLHAGGSFAVAYWEMAEVPCLVEKVEASAGLDVGLVMIGMHLRPVAVPLRLEQKTIGQARVTAAYSRDKLIGGERASYQ